MTTQICFNCDGVIEPIMIHNCIRGITENINRLHSNLNASIVGRLDHLDGLKYGLAMIEEVESYYKSMGVTYEEEHYNPFHDMKNKLRMLLGLKLISR